MDRLFAVMPAPEAQRVLSFVDALGVFEQASDKRSAAKAMSARLAPFGYRGLSYPSLMRKLQDFKSEGVWAFVPAKYKRVESRGAIRNEDFVEYWQGLCLENRRKVAPAWKQLVRDFCAGVAVPGVGTWQEMFFRMRGYMPGVGELCPWSESNPPPGWGLRNLRRLCPDEFAMTAAHFGLGRAKTQYGLTVAKTRVGLRCCQLVEVDDMWYEHKVVFAGNREPQRVVEFAAQDRLTGHVVCHLAKPIRERADGTKETLKAAWAKYVYHFVLCVSGIPREGCVIQGERGTTKSDAEFEAALKAINVRREGEGKGAVSFRSGALVTGPIGKGLAAGAAKGNPRAKGMIEQMHATLKNELGGVLGEVGGGRGVQPEETNAMVAEASRLVTAAYALNLPVEELKTPFLSWQQFAKAADEAHRRMDERREHNLEGWAECGFCLGEVRMKAEASWRTVPALGAMSPEEAGAVSALVKAGYAEYRERKMSPKEAWEKSKGELERVPEYFSPMILGSELCVVAKVRDSMEFRYKDPNTGADLKIAAVAGGELLKRGVEYRVWVNPLDGDKAYVCDLEGRYIGTAKVMQAVRADATPEELAEQLGLRQRVLAEEMKRVAPVVKRRQAAALARAGHNIAVLSGALDGPRPTGDGFSLEELNGCDTISSPADSMPIGRGSVAAGEDSSSALDFLSEMSQV